MKTKFFMGRVCENSHSILLQALSALPATINTALFLSSRHHVCVYFYILDDINVPSAMTRQSTESQKKALIFVNVNDFSLAMNFLSL